MPYQDLGRNVKNNGVAPWFSSTAGIALRLFIICWLVYSLHFATNTVREIYPALSLGDHLTFDVSEYLGLHPDIFEIPGRGAFINNNPGASILAAIPYALSRPIIDYVVNHVQRERDKSPEPLPEYDTPYPLAKEFHRKARERGLDVKFGLATGVIQVLLMAPLSALSAVVIFYLLFSSTGSARAAWFLSLLYAFATPVFYRTAQLNHNLLLSHCALFAFALLWRPWDDRSRPERPAYLLAGLLCGWAMVLDYSGLIVIVSLGLYALVRRSSLPPEVKSKADIWRFSLGVIASLTVLGGYQWACFGSPFYPAQHYMPLTEWSHFGYQGMDWPQLDLLWDTAFGMRFGLFTSAPLLLLALYVPGWLYRDTLIVGDREKWFVVLFCVAFFLFCSMNQYGRMQFNSGVRHVVPVTPFIFLLASEVLLRMSRIAAVLVGIVATYWSWCLAMYRDVEQGLGVVESIIHISLEGLRLPWLKTLEAMGYVSSSALVLPLLLLFAAVTWALYSVGKPFRLLETTKPSK